MGKLYGIFLLNKSQHRDRQIESVLSGDLDHKIDDFEYIFELNNTLNNKGVGKQTKVYKTLNGANKFIEKLNNNQTFKLRYVEYKEIDGKTNIRSYLRLTDDYTPIVFEITKEWDDYIQKLIDQKTASYNFEVASLRKKMSK